MSGLLLIDDDVAQFGTQVRQAFPAPGQLVAAQDSPVIITRESATRKEIVAALGVLSQHLIVLLDPAAIVDTMHAAYERLNLAASPNGVFLAGPSATGDIEGVIIHGAQGARSLTVLLLAPAAEGGNG
jgi:L-lactate dehydrogenase complex protein LldG